MLTAIDLKETSFRTKEQQSPQPIGHIFFLLDFVPYVAQLRLWLLQWNDD